MFKLMLAALLVASIAPAVLMAFPIAEPGTEGFLVIVNSTDEVIATYQGNSASYSNDLYLENTGLFLFNNHSSPWGSQVNLGSFPVGTELIFRLHVNNTGYDYFTGPGTRNPDGHTHARVQANWQPSETLVSFEDLYNGPFVYNDLSFSFTNTVDGYPVCDAGGPYAGDAGVAIQFDGSASFMVGDGEIVTYDWDFGDGNTGSGPTPTHTYASDGEYTVTLCVTDDDEDMNCCSPESAVVPSQRTDWGTLKTLYR